MKTSPNVLTKTAAVLLGSLTLCGSVALGAEPPPPVVAPEAVLAKPADFAGKTIAVHGAVDRVSAARRMFTLVEKTEAGCTDGCARAVVTVVLPADSQATLPAPSQEVLVVGQIEAGATPQLRVSEIVVAKDELQRRLLAGK